MTAASQVNPERWRQVERLYHMALARPAGARAAFLADACGDDAALRRDVVSLLERPASLEEFLAAPAAELSAGIGNTDAETVLVPRLGRTLGSYRIERLLGRGGMGAVFLAYDRTLHRQVALKVLDRRGDGGINMPHR